MLWFGAIKVIATKGMTNVTVAGVRGEGASELCGSEQCVWAGDEIFFCLID